MSKGEVMSNNKKAETTSTVTINGIDYIPASVPAIVLWSPGGAE